MKLRAEVLQKVETFSKPGTADVTPADLKRLRPLLEHYRKKPRPFTACKRDQIKHGLSEGHANRRCAVVVDLIHGHTRWRGKGKVTKSSDAWTEEVVAALDRAGDAMGLDQNGLEKVAPTGAVADAISRRKKKALPC